MNQNIHLQINSIAEKAERLIKDLTALKNENENLRVSNEELQMKITQSNEQLEDYRAQIAQFEKSQSTLKSATDASADESKKRNQQIDQIVREIENCIDQLKQ